MFTKFYFFFFNDTATTEIYTLSLHDALPISRSLRYLRGAHRGGGAIGREREGCWGQMSRSEEHTSELQSRFDLVCRLLLEKKKGCRVADQEALTGLIRLPRGLKVTTTSVVIV